jgi:hypothetical protein
LPGQYHLNSASCDVVVARMLPQVMAALSRAKRKPGNRQGARSPQSHQIEGKEDGRAALSPLLALRRHREWTGGRLLTALCRTSRGFIADDRFAPMRFGGRYCALRAIHFRKWAVSADRMPSAVASPAKREGHKAGSRFLKSISSVFAPSRQPDDEVVKRNAPVRSRGIQ